MYGTGDMKHELFEPQSAFYNKDKRIDRMLEQGVSPDQVINEAKLYNMPAELKTWGASKMGLADRFYFQSNFGVSTIQFNTLNYANII